MPLAPEFERHPGTDQFHGGVIASLIDVAGDFAGYGLGGGVPTINLRIDYLHRQAAIGSRLLRQSAAPAGRLAWSTYVVDGSDRLVAIGRGGHELGGRQPNHSSRQQLQRPRQRFLLENGTSGHLPNGCRSCSRSTSIGIEVQHAQEARGLPRLFGHQWFQL